MYNTCKKIFFFHKLKNFNLCSSDLKLKKAGNK